MEPVQNRSQPPSDDRKPWEPMAVTLLGNVGEVIQAGGGKISAPTGDPGEPFRKPSGLS